MSAILLGIWKTPSYNTRIKIKPTKYTYCIKITHSYIELRKNENINLTKGKMKQDFTGQNKKTYLKETRLG